MKKYFLFLAIPFLVSCNSTLVQCLTPEPEWKTCDEEFAARIKPEEVLQFTPLNDGGGFVIDVNGNIFVVSTENTKKVNFNDFEDPKIKCKVGEDLVYNIYTKKIEMEEPETTPIFNQ